MEKGVALRGRQLLKARPGTRGFAVVPEDGLFGRACAAVVEESRKALERHAIAEAP